MTSRIPSNFRRVITAAAGGNVIEWYDFYIFGSLATILSVKFFEKSHPVFNLFTKDELELLSRAKVDAYTAARGVAPDSVIAYIGGGSRAWARKLMTDLALCPQLNGEVRLYDIDEASARLNEQLGNWLQGQPGVVSHWRYRTTETLPETLQGADFVIISIQPGTLEVMEQEIAIAERYGLYYPVGDSSGVPGLVRGLRSAIIFAGFANAIAEHCPAANRPERW